MALGPIFSHTKGAAVATNTNTNTNTVQEHEEAIEACMKAIKLAGLTLNPIKCFFGRSYTEPNQMLLWQVLHWTQSNASLAGLTLNPIKCFFGRSYTEPNQMLLWQVLHWTQSNASLAGLTLNPIKCFFGRSYTEPNQMLLWQVLHWTQSNASLAGLTLNPIKCFFGKSEISFWGMALTSTLQKLKNWKYITIPTNKQGFISFLCMMQSNSAFISNFCNEVNATVNLLHPIHISNGLRSTKIVSNTCLQSSRKTHRFLEQADIYLHWCIQQA